MTNPPCGNIHCERDSCHGCPEIGRLRAERDAAAKALGSITESGCFCGVGDKRDGNHSNWCHVAKARVALRHLPDTQETG